MESRIDELPFCLAYSGAPFISLPACAPATYRISWKITIRATELRPTFHMSGLLDTMATLRRRRFAFASTHTHETLAQYQGINTS